MALTVDIPHLFPLENSVEHHTELFKLLHYENTAIFRRGQPFNMGIKFDRPLDKNQDIVKICLMTGPNPTPTRGTGAILIVKEKKKLDKNKWDAQFSTFTESAITLQINIPPYAPVAIWEIIIYTTRKDTADIRKHHVATYIYILFNPWCSKDGVYMNKQKHLDEYVLNDNGKVWQGTHKRPVGCNWFFGQFDPIILPSIMLLLNRASILHHDRADPVKMARCISAITNSNDDNGLIVGRWDGKYDDGTSPMAWIDSTSIFEQFYNTQSSVKYGQCWVFSALVVTICRALGIPCRSVTNYISAHDTNSSLTIDSFIDDNGEKIKYETGLPTSDSCWNFHVWNDVWMDRPDLAKGYGGWQAIDSTPQETSNNMFRCGPAPIVAIRRGEVNIGFDTTFVYTEVRADLIEFQKNKDNGFWMRVNTTPNFVGKLIVTKKIGQKVMPKTEDMENITEFYKNRYNSPEDKLAKKKAIKAIPIAQQIYELEKKEIEDVNFLLFENEPIMFGETFKIAINMTNKSSKSRSISIVMSASSILYTGTILDKIKRLEMKVVLQPNQSDNVHTYTKFFEYIDKLSAHNLVKITGVASVQETGQLWSRDDDFSIIMPQLDIMLKSPLTVEEPSEVTITTTNPLSITLTNCTYSIAGPAIHKVIKFRNILPNEKNVIHKEVFTPKKIGDHVVTVSFNSKQITNIKNTFNVTVK